MDNSWIKIHRKMLDWEWRSDTNTFAIFINLLLMATHKPTKWRGFDLAPGQIITGRHQLSKLTGLSPMSVRTCLNHLNSTNEITIKSTNKFSIITIVKWECYQAINQQPNQRPTSNQPATNHIQEGKKERKNTVLTDNDLLNTKQSLTDLMAEDKNFENFWRSYPKQRAGAKDKSYAAWKRAIRKVDPEHLIQSCAAYAISDEVQRGFAKGCAAWLNDERWATDYTNTVQFKSSKQSYSDTLQEAARRAIQNIGD